MAKNSTSNTTYATLSGALSAANAAAPDNILLLGAPYDGAVTLTRGVNLKGGWNALYQSLSGLQTTLNNGLTVEGGTSTLETIDIIGNLTVKGGKLRAKGVKVK